MMETLLALWRKVYDKTDATNSALGFLLIAALIGMWKGITAVPEHYKAIGRSECREATANKSVELVSSGASAVAAKASEDIARSQQSGTNYERARARINSHYQRLDTEARHAPSSPADQCALPADRLRLWKSANDGPGTASAEHQGATSAQPHSATGGAAPADIGAPARSGGEPSGSREGVPPTRGPAVQPAAVPGD